MSNIAKRLKSGFPSVLRELSQAHKLFASLSSDASSKGFILPVILITGVMIVLIIAAISSETIANNNVANQGNYAVSAQLAADAGLDFGLNQMNTVANWSGTSSNCPTSGECTLLNDTAHNLKTTYNVTVINGSDSSHKTLSVVANVYSPTTASSPILTRKYLMDVEAVTSGTGSASLASGVGGLVLNNNAKISGGDVVVDGVITLNGNSQIGLSTNPVNVRDADYACPKPATSAYPELCPAGSNPITLNNNARIYADVIATNQTNGTHMSNDGLQTGQTFPFTALPSFNRSSFETTINGSGQTMTGSQASTCSGNTVNWPANVKITGNVSISGNCTAKINGNAWISGSLSINNNAKLAIQNTVGSTQPDIVVDGSGGLSMNNNSQVQVNSSNTGAEFLTFYSTAACSPECTSVTGTDLYNSQNITTISLNNNSSMPNSVIYAYWTRVDIVNNGQIGAVAGQTVELDNNSVITFTSSVPGSNNLITTWVKRGYMRSY